MELQPGHVARWLTESSGLGHDARRFAHALGNREGQSRRLFVVGTAQWEPWHFTAHLHEHAAQSGRNDLIPTLLRWKVFPGSPPHLSMSVDALSQTERNESVLIVTPEAQATGLFERVADAKRRGSRILAIHRGSEEFSELAHEMLYVGPRWSKLDFDLSQHVTAMTAATGHHGSTLSSRLVHRLIRM